MLVFVEHGGVQRREQRVEVLRDLFITPNLTDLVYGPQGIETAHRVVTRNFIPALHLADGDQGLVDVLQLLDEVLTHIDAELRFPDDELEFNVHVDGSSRFDGDFTDLFGRVLVTFDAAFGRYCGVAIHMDKCEVGEAVFVLFRLDQEKDLFVVFMEEVVICIHLVIVRGWNDNADVGEAEGFRCEFLEQGSTLWNQLGGSLAQ